MQETTVRQTGPVSAEIDILVGKSEVEAEFGKFCNEIKDRVLINGFRKGAAPLGVIRQKFANEIKTEVSARLVSQKTEEIIKEKGLKVAGNPALKKQYKVAKDKQWIGHFRLDGGFEYAVETELEPEVEISNYADIEVEIDLPNAQDWLDGRIKELQTSFAERKDIVRPLQIGDEVTLDFVAEVDGQKLDGEVAKFHTAIIGSGDLTKQFEDNLIGRNPGMHADFEITFPADFVEPFVAGKTARFSVNIHTATEIILHPVNDELAQKAVYENVAQMMSELKEKADEEYEKPRKAKQLEAIMTVILERNPLEVPNSWVDNEVSVIAHRLGMKKLPDDAEQMNALREIAHRSVQQSFVFDKIYQKEPTLHITKEEIEDVLAKEGARVGKTAADVLGHLKNSGTYEGFISFNEHQKVTNFLIESSTIKEKV